MQIGVPRRLVKWLDGGCCIEEGKRGEYLPEMPDCMLAIDCDLVDMQTRLEVARQIQSSSPV